MDVQEMKPADIIKNDPAKSGRIAGKAEFFGNNNRYRIFPVHTPGRYVIWEVADADEPEEASKLASIIARKGTREEALLVVAWRIIHEAARKLGRLVEKEEAEAESMTEARRGQLDEEMDDVIEDLRSGRLLRIKAREGVH